MRPGGGVSISTVSFAVYPTTISSGNAVNVYWTLQWGADTQYISGFNVSIDYPNDSTSSWSENDTLAVYPSTSGYVTINASWSETYYNLDYDILVSLERSAGDIQYITVGGGTTYSPTITSFTASSSSIVSGSSTTLTWTANTDTDSISPDFGAPSTPVSSSISVSPTVTTTYHITPYHGTTAGTTVATTVTVTQPPPPSTDPTITSFNNGAATQYGGTYELVGTNFNTLGVYLNVSLYFNNYYYTYLTFTKNSDTSITVTLPGTGIPGDYYLSIHGYFGVVDSKLITIAAATPIATITYFYPNAEDIYNGQSVTLYWSTQNTTSIVTSGFSATAVNGYKSVTPASNTTTTYTITPYNGSVAGTPVSVSVTATVVPTVYAVSSPYLIGAAGNSTSSIGYVTRGSQRSFGCTTNDTVTWSVVSTDGPTVVGSWSGNVWTIPSDWLYRPTHDYMIRATCDHNSSAYVDFHVRIVVWPFISDFYPVAVGVENHNVTSGTPATLYFNFNQSNGTYDTGNVGTINNGVGTLTQPNGSEVGIHPFVSTVQTGNITSNITFRLTTVNAAGDSTYRDTAVYVVAATNAGTMAISKNRCYSRKQITLTPSFTALAGSTYKLVMRINDNEVETIADPVTSGQNYTVFSKVSCTYSTKAINSASYITYSTGGGLSVHSKYTPEVLYATDVPQVSDAWDGNVWGNIIIEGMPSRSKNWAYAVVEVTCDINNGATNGPSVEMLGTNGYWTYLGPSGVIISQAQYDQGIRVTASASSWVTYDEWGQNPVWSSGTIRVTQVKILGYSASLPPNGLKAIGI